MEFEFLALFMIHLAILNHMRVFWMVQLRENSTGYGEEILYLTFQLKVWINLEQLNPMGTRNIEYINSVSV